MIIFDNNVKGRTDYIISIEVKIRQSYMPYKTGWIFCSVS